MADNVPAEQSVWDAERLRDPHAQPDKAARVESMFDAIAPTYERVNRLASLGMDARWRRRAIAAADLTGGEVVVDLCCGTGDMVRAFAGATPAPRVVLGLDFSAQMLSNGQYPPQPVPLQLFRADALRLPLADASADVISCAFGVRNFQDLPRGLAEMRRVLRPGGRVVILEFAAPENPLVRWGHNLYCDVLLPRLGQWLSRDRTGAYRYLPESIRTFARRGQMVEALRAAGFDDVRTFAMNLGSVIVYRGC